MPRTKQRRPIVWRRWAPVLIPVGLLILTAPTAGFVGGFLVLCILGVTR